MEKKLIFHRILLKSGMLLKFEKRAVRFSLEGAIDAVVRRGIPQWLDLEKENMKGMVKEFPSREDITTPIQEQLIVELYSK